MNGKERGSVMRRSGRDSRHMLPLAAQAGQALVWVAVMLPLLLVIAGLAIDGGRLFAARRELQNLADAGARAGAMQVGEQVYRESSGARVVLDPDDARAAAAAYLAAEDGLMDMQVEVEPQRVTVQVRREVRTAFIRLVGIDHVRIEAVAPAEVRYGIERANR